MAAPIAIFDEIHCIHENMKKKNILRGLHVNTLFLAWIVIAMIVSRSHMSAVVCFTAKLKGKTSGSARTRYLKMDDEIARKGIKEELTTREEYLDGRFTRLSKSGHDLTPLTLDEVERKKAEQNTGNTGNDGNAGNENVITPFLGYNQKGLYVCNIGGLPLFASGCRVESACNKDVLVFTECVDEDHIRVTQKSNGKSSKVTCVRSGTEVGSVTANVFSIIPTSVAFLSLSSPWPIESQPENYWGTEGQFMAWKQSSEMSSDV